ncbi:MAG: hypothetical protein GOVbin2066_15 [Prokaryotic dsDNA virus sp.]|nr:MAG: hypothetical protein GOVbin2066_15 [Prokaryotic dsDNA virus sp.]|tara:strand:- start:8439 stop:8597 length:159 start_codon:yes stop_codon:yes gene_type:complete
MKKKKHSFITKLGNYKVVEVNFSNKKELDEYIDYMSKEAEYERLISLYSSDD